MVCCRRSTVPAQENNNGRNEVYAVIARMDQETLIVVENIISNPHETDKYILLKEALLNHYAIPQERRFKMLLSGVELRDRRPSELLAEIHRLGGNHLDAAFVRTIWFDRLPPLIKLALAGTGEENNTILAGTADRLMEVQRGYEDPGIMAVTYKFVAGSDMKKQLDELVRQVEKLAQRLDKASFNGSNRSKSTPSASQDNIASTPYYYHRKFGQRAKKCTRPCTFQGNTNGPQ
ncbi:uncharacterized protein LOC126764660 [Bactrocera neohumeralis]|uniref:uncharacterized protein LOC126764660 n=1 Tax=Bactrocera neohumeralis TaxID=98809 RepID=UPI0021658E2C|nr:uncharacterized protein LOC126764660 [Bactrocera neohumeralis]